MTLFNQVKRRFGRGLLESYALWSGHVDQEVTSSVPIKCTDLKSILGQTPSFLGHGLVPEDETVSFRSAESSSGLSVNGRSTWRTSNGAFSHKGYDDGNYIRSVIFAWVYILNARWAELLKSISRAPLRWWNAILSPNEGWSVTTVSNGSTYTSPWTKQFSKSESQPPSSDKAVQYLARFCCHKRRYGQCSVAFSTVLCVPFVWTKSVTLPFPKMPNISDLLPRYMILSCDMGGIRSLLHVTFFNPEIKCNVVAACISAALAVIDPIIKEGNMIKPLQLFARRLPKLAPLWLGTILLENADALQPIKGVLVAVKLHAAAWTGVTQSVIILSPDVSNGKVIRCEGECRLFHTFGGGNLAKHLVWSWRPFPETMLSNAKLQVQKHARCGIHCLEYLDWYGEPADGKFDVEDSDGEEILDGNEVDSVINDLARQKAVEDWLARSIC
ncbi:hypothetical protein BDV23DRAFT_172798 [Aspergillus alliaceus]|uniref:Uncharacterized protein n=1 Tax=Petromyces alliaceus TaxID=209559 RepID=A0A5N7C742_PETAA|nr:hypothetical protein BDV23DRAFT_172798 [Aspergillus alliaceus]